MSDTGQRPPPREDFRDCRLLLAGVLMFYFAVLLVMSINLALDDAWNKLGVPALGLFGDLLFITRDGEAVLHGLPRTEGFFYPPACYWFAHLGLGERHNTAAGIVLGVGFFTAALLVFGRVRREHLFYYAALLCSPSIMLGVARGNIDLFVFILLAIALLLLHAENNARKAAAYLLIVFAAMLKLYPIVGAAVAVREKRYRWLLVGLSMGVLFGIYLWFSRDDLRDMFKLAPRFAFLTFGAPVIFDRIWFGDPANPKYGAALSALVFAGSWIAAWRSGSALRRDSGNAHALDSFRIGSAIYLGCFALIQYNFVYRHMMLLLTVPQWLEWRRAGGRTARIATVALANLALAFWLPRYARNWWNLDQLCDWILFALHSYALIATAPDEVRKFITPGERTATASF